MLAGFSNNFEGLWSIAEHKLSEFSLQNQRFALGLSGGADSIGLFHVFSSFLKQKKISDLVVFHINFGLRGEESDGDEAFVRSICSADGVHLDVFKAKIEKGSGVQESARAFRRQIQHDYIKKGFVIALAHNSNDLTENVLLRLSRGASIETAAGMTYFNGEIFRPWLDIARADIRSALLGKSYGWREDSSNDTDIYARNKIRQSVIPILETIFPGASKRISSAFLSRVPANRAIEAFDEHAVSMAVLSNAAKDSLCSYVHEFLGQHYGGACPVSRPVILQIATAIHRISSGLDGESRTFHLPDRKNLVISRSEIRIVARN